jgi:hypothetical protein
VILLPQSNGIIENIDYKVFTGSNFMALKALSLASATGFASKNQNSFKALSLGSSTPRPLFDICFIPSITKNQNAFT